jgi:hypothetical protein
MKTAKHQPSSEGAIWARIVHPEAGDLSHEATQTLLGLHFNSADRQRMDELAEKAGAGTLSTQERREAETYNRVSHLLALLQSKARRSLLPRIRC